ncbi:Hypothetical Protein FCC1311_030812 [Hondaea fermentalgiana]|uniref:Uncharacterized protein n=1 Tax=Hondaea fermentalgiana TaxID=2315210 RepID=A0A2R5G949_9STRA|nr:Hypothetical Protein FCC1311_030812 [Hondaea fermentalgiana]|eukprot:GBG26859.1 Hypothetical Protein FCC1311_030812 [Hondaea fermentalgiana]
MMKMNSSHTQSRDAVVRAVSENKLEYKEFPSWNDDNAAPGFDLEFVADKVIPQNLTEDFKRNNFAETFDPAVQHFTKGGNASVLVLHWDPRAVLVACQGFFQNIELVRALQLDFDGSCSPNQGVTLSWVELNGAFGIRDALAEAVSAGRNSQRPSSASADDRPRIEDGGGALLNVLEVRLGDIKEALQLVERMSQVDRSGRPSHRVLTVKRGEARLQLVFADSREPLELQHFNTVLEALEAQRPAVPFHTSRIANLLRGALLDREAFVVVGSVGCRPEPSGVSGSSENLAHESVELRVADPDRAIAVLGIMSRLQQFCGVRVHEIEQDLCNNQESETDAFTGDHDIAHIQRLHGSSTCELYAASEAGKELDHLNPAMAVSGLEAFEAEARRIEEKLRDTDMPIEEQSTRVLGLLEQQVAEGMEAEDYRFAAQEAARWIKAAVRRLDDNGAALDTLQDTNEFLSAENQGLVESTTRLEEELAQTKKELARVNDELSESRVALEKVKSPSTQALQHDMNSKPGSSSVGPKSRSPSKNGHVMARSQDGASVHDFALYRHVMETTVLRIQEELNTAIQERDAAQESCRKIETKARKDHRAAQEQRKYVKEVSEKLTALFHESQAQKQDLNDLREAHEKLIARQKRERYELEALRKQRYGLQVERDALAKEMETLTQNLKEGFEREKHGLQRKLVETKAQLDKALADAVVYRAAPRNHAPRQVPAARDATSEDTGMSDIVSLLRERKKAMLASAEISQPKTGKSSRPQARVRRENGSVTVPELRMADLNTTKRHRVKSDRASEPFVRRRPPFPHEKPPWKIAGA